ncbi:MAG: TetR/AcrR family transcriptional regulator [Clostridium sp.]|uniref:TetR/AcrR family transcriptional regulator n=1 Tax=Clostridium sp. TaxID=1506 RepID=UPI003D6D84A2
METKKIKKRMNKEDRMKQILEAAMTVFVEKGFNASTTLEIAKVAEISEVTLFRNFSSKQEIFLKGIEPILFSTLKQTINDSKELSPLGKLEYILYDRISLISENREIIKLILMESHLLTELGNENFIEKILKVLKNILTKIGIPKEDEEFTLRMLMGGILSFLYMPETNEENIKKYVKKIISLIL